MTNEIITFLVAALPLSELRGAIPLAILKFGFNPYKAFFISVLGNLLPVLPLLIGLDKVSEYLSWVVKVRPVAEGDLKQKKPNFYYPVSHKFYWSNRFFSWLFERTRARHGSHFHYWGDIALFIFIAIPLPLTGVYSGLVAAFVFGIPKKHAFWSAFFGILAAGFLVTAATVFGESIFKYLLIL